MRTALNRKNQMDAMTAGRRQTSTFNMILEMLSPSWTWGEVLSTSDPGSGRTTVFFSISSLIMG